MVINLAEEREARQPHFTLMGIDGNAHVFPVELAERMVRGEVPLDDVLVRSIIRDWLGKMGG